MTGELTPPCSQIHGLVFLFKWRAGEVDARPAVDPAAAPGVYFPAQVINNACATQAILGVLMNAEGVELGPDLANLKAFTQDFPPDLKGLAIGNCEGVRRAHNSFARPEPFLGDERTAREDDDVFHFISYVPVDGVLWELDGLKPGPVRLGPCDGGAGAAAGGGGGGNGGGAASWVEVARPHIQERIARYSQSEIRFNLLAVIRSRLQGLEERLGAARGRSEAAELASREGGAQGEGLAGSRSELEAARAEAAAEVEAATAALQAEQAKRRAWHDENVRRRHNYIPFLFHFLKTLAEKKQLKPLIERARELQQAP